jgi:hypothetical protein
MTQKKNAQLGMNVGTATYRLTKDILFKFVASGEYTCFHCGQPMKREDFSIEHKNPWLDSEDPLRLFFDLENIAFSHKSCNIGAARRPNKLDMTPEERKKHDANIERQRWQKLSPEEQQAIRRRKYERNGV